LDLEDYILEEILRCEELREDILGCGGFKRELDAENSERK
jgi:hypothetical protein